MYKAYRLTETRYAYASEVLLWSVGIPDVVHEGHFEVKVNITCNFL